MLLLIPLLPLAGFAINAGLGRRLSKSASGAVACLAVIGAFVVSVVSAWPVFAEGRIVSQTVFTWMTSGELDIPFALRVDPLVGADDPGRHAASDR